jgi:hypothetical protein
MVNRSKYGTDQVSCIAMMSILTLLLERRDMRSRSGLNLLCRLWALILRKIGMLEFEYVWIKLLMSLY